MTTMLILICIFSATTGSVTSSSSSSSSQPLDFVVLPTSSAARCVTSLPGNGGSIWAVEERSEFSAQGYFPISQLYSERGCDEALERPLVVARKRGRNIALPVSYTRESQLTAGSAFAVFKLVCPRGYVSLGDVIHNAATTTSSGSGPAPNVADHRCVKEALTVGAERTQQIGEIPGKLRSVARSSGWNSGGFFSTSSSMRVLKRTPEPFQQSPLFVLAGRAVCVGVIATIGSSAVHGSVWRPVPPRGYHTLGHVVVEGNGGCDVTPPSIVVGRSSGDSLASPTVTSSTTDHTWKLNYRIFKCPRDYVAMGAIAIGDAAADNVTDFRCVNEALTRSARIGSKLLVSSETGAAVYEISTSSSSWKSNFFLATTAFTPTHIYTLLNDPFDCDVTKQQPASTSRRRPDDDDDVIMVIEDRKEEERGNDVVRRESQLDLKITAGITVGVIGIFVSTAVVVAVCFRSWRSKERRASTKSDVITGMTASDDEEYHVYASIDNELYSPMTSEEAHRMMSSRPRAPLPHDQPPTIV